MDIEATQAESRTKMPVCGQMMAGSLRQNNNLRSEEMGSGAVAHALFAFLNLLLKLIRREEIVVDNFDLESN